MRINAEFLDYRRLNGKVREALNQGENSIEVDGVNGHRYLAAALSADHAAIRVKGVPGNDLACFLGAGIRVEVLENCQDGAANTMGDGKVVIRGSAGDITGYAMRGGKLFVGGDVGYRAGIHMKAYRDSVPVIVVGGNTGSYLGEYMAGGIIIVLGLGNGFAPRVGTYLGTGMHGGAIYLRGNIDPAVLGEAADIKTMEDEDWVVLRRELRDYCEELGLDFETLANAEYTKVAALSRRPYGSFYAY